MSPLKQRMLEDMQLRLSGFSVDWVLLRDAARTLMKAAILIRKRGFQARMEEPEAFLNRMNRLCMKMSHARRKKDAKRARQAVPREMKKLSGNIGASALGKTYALQNLPAPASAQPPPRRYHPRMRGRSLAVSCCWGKRRAA